MGERLGMVVQDLMDAARIGARSAAQGRVVRIMTPWTDLAELDARLAAERLDLAIIVAEGARADRAAAALQRWGTMIQPDRLLAGGEAKDFSPLTGIGPGGAGGTLVLAGSAAPQARAQVERLADEGALVLTLPREAVLNQDESYLMGIRSGAAAAIKQGRNVVIRSENWPEALLVTRKLAAKRFIPVDELERRVRTMLARAGQGVVEAAGTRRLVGLGTETCSTLCEVLSIRELLPVGEVAPGLPVLLAPGERPLLLLLKAGTGGEDDLLVRAAAAMSGLADR